MELINGREIKNIEELTKQALKSPNWDRYAHVNEFIFEGFPFNEGFPKGMPCEILPKAFMLKLRDGSTCVATVDYELQYRTEGIKWKVHSGQFRGKRLDKGIVAGWNEIIENK